MPNNMNESNKGGQVMPNKSTQGQSSNDLNRNAGNLGQNKGYGKDTGMGRQGSSSSSQSGSGRTSNTGNRSGQR